MGFSIVTLSATNFRRLKSTVYQIALDIVYHTPISQTHRQARARTRSRLPFYKQFIQPGDLCFHIGANIGDRTDVFATLGAQVIAVDPMRDLAVHLRRRFALTRRVRVKQMALGAKDGVAELAICDAATTANTLSTSFQRESRFAGTYTWNRTESVRMTTLDSLIREYGQPAFCKIDVEGFESVVFAGLSRPLSCLSFEFTREFLHEMKQCVSHLETLGRASYNYALGEEMRLLLSTWISAEELVAHLSEHPASDLWGDIYVRWRPDSN